MAKNNIEKEINSLTPEMALAYLEEQEKVVDQKFLEELSDLCKKYNRAIVAQPLIQRTSQTS